MKNILLLFIFVMPIALSFAQEKDETGKKNMLLKNGDMTLAYSQSHHNQGFLIKEQDCYGYHFLTPWYGELGCGGDIIVPFLFSINIPLNLCYHSNCGWDEFYFFFDNDQYMLMKFQYPFDRSYSSQESVEGHPEYGSTSSNNQIDTLFFIERNELRDEKIHEFYCHSDEPSFFDSICEVLPCKKNIWAVVDNIYFLFFNISDLNYQEILNSLCVHRKGRHLTNAEGKFKIYRNKLGEKTIEHK